MAGKSRKISFYRLSIEKSEPIPGTRTHRIINLTNEEIENNFKIIYENKMTTYPTQPTGDNSIDLNTLNNLIKDLKIPLNNKCENYTISWNNYSYI